DRPRPIAEDAVGGEQRRVAALTEHRLDGKPPHFADLHHAPFVHACARLNIPRSGTDGTQRARPCGRREVVVVAGLIAVVVVSILVARAGLAYLDGAKSFRTALVPTSDPAIDLTDPEPDAPVEASLRTWLLRGFDLPEARAWIQHGFDPDHAFL